MKGKGARMFAKRQERMEKFIVGGNSESTEDGTVEKENLTSCSQINHTQKITEIIGNKKDTPNSANSVTDENLFFPSSHTNKTTSDDFQMQQKQLKQKNFEVDSRSESGKEILFSPKERSPWSTFSNTEQSTCSEVQHINLESDSSSYLSDDQYQQKMVFRSVKPPQPTSLCIMSPVDTNVSGSSANLLDKHKQSHFSVSLQNPAAKIWSSVKFDPTANSSSRIKGMMTTEYFMEHND